MLQSNCERSFNETDHALLEAEKEAFSRLAQGQGIAAALNSLLTAVEDLAGNEMITSVWNIDSAQRTIYFYAGPSVPPSYRDAAHGMSLHPDRGSCGRAISLNQPVIVPDVGTSALWSHCVDLLRSAGLHASWSTPITSSFGRILGTFAVYYREPRQPPVEHIQLVNRVSQTAALLIERHHSDEIIQAREEQLRLISDTLPALVSYVDADERYVFCNKRYVDWFGLSADQIMGRHMSAVLGQDAWKTIGPRLKAALAGEVVEYEAEVPYSRGGTRWIHAVYTPHRDRDGLVAGVIVHVSDISTRKHLEQAVREGEERFHRYFELGLIGSAITSPNKGWLEVNDELCRILGYERNDLMRITWEELTHPDDLSADVGQFDRVLSGEIDGYTLDKRFIRRDGRVIDTAISVKCLRRADGSVEYFLAMVQDITMRKQAEAALRESEERYRHLVKIMPAAIYMCDRAGRITFYNDQAVRVWGRTPQPGDDERRFCGSYKLFHSDGSPLPHEHTPMADVLRDGIHYRNQEVVIERPDGTRSAVLVNIDPLISDGAIMGAVNVFTDITERKQAQQALEMSEARYRSLFESIDEGFCVIEVVFDEHQKSVDYVFLEANPAFEKETGIANVCGKRMREIVPDHEVHWFELYGSVALTGEPRRFEYPAVGLGRWYEGYAFRFEESHEHRIGVLFSDITERKRIEETLRESEARLQQLADSMPQIVWTAGPDGSIDYFNERWYEYTGFSHEKIDQAKREAILHPDDLDRCKAMYSCSIESGQPYQIEFRFQDRFTAGYRWFMERALPMQNERGEIVRWFGTCTDIDDVKQAEAALREREEELRNLTEQLEHRVVERTQELVDSHAQLRALATELNLTEQRERTRLATELHDHLQQLLVLAKLKLGQGRRLAETIPACADTMKETDDVLTEALDYTRTLVAELSPPVLREHGFTASLKWLSEYMKRHDMLIVVTVPEPGPDLSEDQAILLFQSVRELLINVSKYAGVRQARVTLQTSRNQLRVTVRDEGKGFDPLFMPTGSANSIPSSKFGLYSIRERMKTLGGSFEINSAPGKGTIATLTLPFNEFRKAKPEPVTALEGTLPVQKPPVLRQSKQGVIRVLLVDDHAMVRQGLRSVLDGYSDVEVVGEAFDGEEAVRIVGALQPQVVVMDINMPKMDGITATERVRVQYPDIVVIGLSVNASVENQMAMKKAGADLLLTKEAVVKHLYVAIKEAVLRVRV